jgi:hypothetical protein
MRTVKWNPFLSGVCALLGGVLLWSGTARADVTSTNTAAILVFPKLVVDSRNFDEQIDTIIQVTNTSDEPVNVRCFYVNANGHCSNDPTTVCNPNSAFNDCGPTAFCVPGWVETDFAIRLTAKQPIVWTVRDGLPTLPLDSPACPTNMSNVNCGSIPPAPEDPMIGELKCVEVGDDEQPVDRNDLKGEATIESAAAFLDGANTIDPSLSAIDIDSRGYNAYGIKAIESGNNNDDVLLLNNQEYNACPNLLVLDHFFDDAFDPAGYERVRTEVTFVPCSEDFLLQIPTSNTVQFLVYNEFEQRFSTSRRVTCLTELPLSDIDTRLGYFDDYTSIFNVNVQGTLTGQTVMRSVAGTETNIGHGILAVAEEFHSLVAWRGFEDNVAGVRSAAYVPIQRGTRTQPDIIYMPAAGPAEP